MSRCKKCGYWMPYSRSKELGERTPRFCLHCGAPLKGEETEKRTFDKRRDYVMAAVYGPPYAITHRCKQCGEKYFEQGLGSPDAKYCPFCGRPYDDEGEEDTPY